MSHQCLPLCVSSGRAHDRLFVADNKHLRTLYFFHWQYYISCIVNIVFLSLTILYFFQCQYCISFIDNIVFLQAFLTIVCLWSTTSIREHWQYRIVSTCLRSSQSKLFWMLFKVAFISKAVGCYLKPHIIQITFSPAYNGLRNWIMKLLSDLIAKQFDFLH